VPGVRHVTEPYADNRIEAEHGRLKGSAAADVRPMCGLRRGRSLQTIATGHAFVQNLRRGHYELGSEHHVSLRARTAFDEIAACI
jgi:IS6 family transposase